MTSKVSPPTPANDAVLVPPSAMVWRICQYLAYRNPDHPCKRCPMWRKSHRGWAMPGCYMLAQEVVNVAQTGDPWRKC